MGMFGIIMMVIENELSSAGVYNKVSSMEMLDEEVKPNILSSGRPYVNRP